jgi:hypothetical protein
MEKGKLFGSRNFYHLKQLFSKYVYRKRDQKRANKIKIEVEETTGQTSKYFDCQIKTESNYLTSGCDQNNNQIKSEEVYTNVKLEPIQHYEENQPEIKKAKWEPAEWKEVLNRIKQMRMDKSAPVDTMGCDALSSLDENLTPQVLYNFMNLSSDITIYSNLRQEDFRSSFL